MSTLAAHKVATYGFRVSRAGEVYAYTARPWRGRVGERHQLFVGNVWRVPGGWRHDAACDIYPTLSEAATAVVRITCN